MGVQLTKWALSADVGARGLSPTARLVLACMTFQAQDRETEATPAREWWGGHDLLMIQLFGDVPEDPREYATLARRIRRAIAELTDSGLIVQTEPAGRGRTATYRINA